MVDLLKFPRIFILQLLASFATVGAILFTPALPEFSKFFELSAHQNQWPVTIYLFGFALGPLLYGPLSNGIGRKKALLLGLALAFAGSLCTFFAFSFWVFCLGRFIQALGAVSGFKIVYTMVGDVYEKEFASKALSILLLGFAFAPGLSLALGGWFTDLFGWRSCFLFLTFYTLFLFFCSLTLPETSKKVNDSSLEIKSIISGYLCQLGHLPLIFYALLMGLPFAMNYVFAIEAPYVGIHLMGLTPGEYGLFGLLLSAGMLIGLWLTHYLAGKISFKTELALGILFCLAGTVLITFFLSIHEIDGWSLFLPQALVQIGNGIIWVVVPVKSLSEVKDKSNASAMSRFLSLGFGTLFTLVATFFLPKNLFTIPLVFVIISFMMLGMWLIILRNLKKT